MNNTLPFTIIKVTTVKSPHIDITENKLPSVPTNEECNYIALVLLLNSVYNFV